MHDQPDPTEEEQEETTTERQEDEEAMRYPAHDDPGEAFVGDEE